MPPAATPRGVGQLSRAALAGAGAGDDASQSGSTVEHAFE